MKIAVFDLDGTLCDTSHRNHYVQGESVQTRMSTCEFSMHQSFPLQLQDGTWIPSYAYRCGKAVCECQSFVPNMEAYEAAAMGDKPNHDIRTLFNSLDSMGYILVVLSTRPQRTMDATAQWMDKYEMYADYLFLQDDELKANEVEVKLAQVQKFILQKATGSSLQQFTLDEIKKAIHLIIDDNPQVCEAFAKQGYTVLHYIK